MSLSLAPEDRVICPECRAAGKKSCVYLGASSVTLSGHRPYYDEDGRYHSHDPNTVTTSFKCSRGHFWVTGRITPCWCGWGKEKE